MDALKLDTPPSLHSKLNHPRKHLSTTPDVKIASPLCNNTLTSFSLSELVFQPTILEERLTVRSGPDVTMTPRLKVLKQFLFLLALKSAADQIPNDSSSPKSNPFKQGDLLKKLSCSLHGIKYENQYLNGLPIGPHSSPEILESVGQSKVSCPF